MKVNPLLMDVRKLPGNIYEHLEFVRKQQEAAPIVALAIAAAVMMIVVAVVFQSCGLGGAR